MFLITTFSRLNVIDSFDVTYITALLILMQNVMIHLQYSFNI